MAKKRESKELKNLRTLIEKRADKVMDPDRPSFNAAEILGISLTPPSVSPTDTRPVPAEAVPGVAQARPGSLTATTGGNTAVHGLAEAEPGVAKATKVVVKSKYTSTSEAQTTPVAAEAVPGVAQARPGSLTATPGGNTAVAAESVTGLRDQSDALTEPRGRRNVLTEFNDTDGGVAEAVPGVAQARPGSRTAIPGVVSPAVKSDDILAAWRLGNGLSVKGVSVLRTLDRYRSVANPACTVPIGYAKLAEKAAVGVDYLRHSVLPGLALRGLIAVASKGFSGTVYRILCDRRIIELIASGAPELQQAEVPDDRTADALLQTADPVQTLTSLPEWVDRQNWGTLSPDTIRHLTEKAGSEEQAREVLEIIVYNETHGPERSRVKNRLSVLSRYLSSPNAELWPADDGYETLTVRRARLERDQAAKQKALAEETFKAQQEERLLRFRTGLSEAQWAWIRSEAKRAVDSAPKAQQDFMGPRTRLNMYKAKEDELIREWLDRTAYGETVPEHA